MLCIEQNQTNVNEIKIMFVFHINVLLLDSMWFISNLKSYPFSLHIDTHQTSTHFDLQQSISTWDSYFMAHLYKPPCLVA